MSCSRTQKGEACGDRTQDLSIRSPTLYHYATALSQFFCKAEVLMIDSYMFLLGDLMMMLWEFQFPCSLPFQLHHLDGCTYPWLVEMSFPDLNWVAA